MMTTFSPTSVPADHSAVRAPRSALAAATYAARAALQWRLLLVWAGLLLLPTLVAALPVWFLLGAQFDHSVHAQELAQRLDGVALADLMGVLAGSSAPGIATGGLAALVLTLLLSPLLTGATITAARAPQQLGLAGLLAGAVQEYGRLLRMLVWALLPLGLAGVLAGIVLVAAGKYGEHAILAADADRASTIAALVAAFLVLVADATLDAGRAILAIDRRRKSAVKAWWHGCKLVFGRPLAAGGTYFAITLLGLGLGALLGVARINVPALGFGGFVAAFALSQLAVLALAWMRGARLVALMELARAARG